MEQDLFDWLNSQRISQGEGLLVAPLNTDATPETQEDNPPSPEEISQHQTEDLPGEILPVEPEDDIPESQNEIPPSSPESDQEPQDSQDESQTVIPEVEHENREAQDETQPFISEDEMAILEPHEETPPESPEHEQDGQDEYPTFILEADKSDDFLPDTESDDDPSQQDHEWQERATGFTLSLDEPPPELWTHINDDDPEPDYEPTDSLQGAAYVQIHGRNFTERLHHTLKHRKERAQERSDAEQENNNSHPYVQKAIILCATLVMALGFACLALWFMMRETPEGMESRALSLVQEGKFEDAANVYRRAYHRFPDRTEFLAGLSEASEKAGHVQTAKAAHDEYIRLTSPDTQPQSLEQETVTTPKPEPETQRKPSPVSLILNERPLTFGECMSEANHAYNIGMYTRALEYFSRAMKLSSRDLRPYIGMSASYRMKGWYVDSMHILEEARRLFGRSPALDMETYFLREAK